MLSLICSNTLCNPPLAGFNLFQQKFWIPSIPSAVQFFLFLISFSRVSSVMLNSFTLVILSLNCLFTLSIHGISGVLSSFSHYVSPKFNKFFHLRYLAYMLCPSYFLKKVLPVSFKVSIIHYSPASLNEFLQFNHFVPKFVNPTLFILF